MSKSPSANSRYGLYDPQFEHDACGVGLAANINGRTSHAIIQNGLEILDNLAHRGACGCDPKTGDGAGMLIQMPHKFFAHNAGITLPPADEYAVSMVFLPQDTDYRRTSEQMIEGIITDEGQHVLGWRDVPVNNSDIGYAAKKSQPYIRQIFIGKGAGISNSIQFERKLYVIRKVIERTAMKMAAPIKEHLYIPSMSCNRIVYKGLLIGTQLKNFYEDLSNPNMLTSFAMVHARFSTNTLGSWRLAHPYRLACHNGEINTLRGNINWMTAREALFSSDLFGDDIHKLLPIITPGASDTASFDNTLELLLATGRSLPHALMMMIPEATGQNVDISPDKRSFYEYHSNLMEPWDGPALIAATDGSRIAIVLDRNGLRPFRYVITKDNLLVMASEVGVLNVDPDNVKVKDRIRPGRLFLLDTEKGQIIDDEQIKTELSRKQPYSEWLQQNRVTLEELPESENIQRTPRGLLQNLRKAFGYTQEDLQIIMEPMAITGAEAIGSMGNDSSLPVLSDKPQLLFKYFKQLFAQVSNPPLDAIREELVTSLEASIGSEQNLFDETPEHCHQLRLTQPIITNLELEKIRDISIPRMKSTTCSTLFDTQKEQGSLETALTNLCDDVSEAVNNGSNIIILSDRGVDAKHAPIPSLLATSAVHHHLIREGTRAKVGLVVESGEPREVMHFALLIGYGAGAINPYLAFDILGDLVTDNVLPKHIDSETATKNLS